MQIKREFYDFNNIDFVKTEEVRTSFELQWSQVGSKLNEYRKPVLKL